MLEAWVSFEAIKRLLALLAVFFLLVIPLNPAMAPDAMDFTWQANNIFDNIGNIGSDSIAKTEQSLMDGMAAFQEAQALLQSPQLLEDLQLVTDQDLIALLQAAQLVKDSSIDGVYYSYEQMKQTGAAYSIHKPARGPALSTFFFNGGKSITIFNNGTCWLYDANINTAAKGMVNAKVLYIEGIIFFPKNVVYQKVPGSGSYVDIGPFGTRTEDSAALKAAMKSLGMTSIPAGYVAHHSAIIDGHYQFVLREVHQFFAHNGGHFFFGCEE